MQWFAGQVIGGLVGFAVALLATLVKVKFVDSRHRRLWNSRKNGSVSIMLSTNRLPTNSYNKPVTGVGGARALAILAPSLTRAYGNFSNNVVQFAAFATDKDRMGDLILLGGPKNNAVTREALARLAHRLPITMITQEDDVILVHQARGDTTLAPEPISKDHKVPRHDLGLIIRTTNPFDSHGTLTILAGTHTYGVIAAAEYLVNEMKELRRYQPEFVAVVDSDITDHEFVEQPVLVRPIQRVGTIQND